MNTAVQGSAPSGQPTGTPPAGPTGTASSSEGLPWFHSIPDEGLRAFAQTKGWKDPAAVTEGYRNLEKLVGVPSERLLKLPEKHDDPAWGDIYTKLGKPGDPTGYELQFEGDPGFAKKMSEIMHQANVPKPMAQAMNAAWNQYVAELTQEAEQAEAQAKIAKQAQADADMATLRAEWGQSFQANEELARRAARESGLTDDDFTKISEAIGAVKALKHYQAQGAKMAEPKPFNTNEAGGGTSQFGMTKEQAAARIQSLMADSAYQAAYMAGDKAKAAELENLHLIVAKGGQ